MQKKFRSHYVPSRGFLKQETASWWHALENHSMILMINLTLRFCCANAQKSRKSWISGAAGDEKARCLCDSHDTPSGNGQYLENHSS